MPAQSVDPRIDEEREHEAVKGAAHDHAGEERQDELDPAHRVAEELLTARTYPVGGTGSRFGSDQRAVMPRSVGQRRADDYLAVWAMPSSIDLRPEWPRATPPVDRAGPQHAALITGGCTPYCAARRSGSRSEDEEGDSCRRGAKMEQTGVGQPQTRQSGQTAVAP
jgi:hypothetical protein